MTYTLPNTVVIAPLAAGGDTRQQGFSKLAANDTYLVGGLNTESGRVDALETAVDDMTGATAYQAAAGTSSTVLLSPLAASQMRGHGEGRLVKSGSDLKLERVGLGRVWVNGLMVQIPVAGVSLSTSGLSDATLYYIYLGKTDTDGDLDGTPDGYTLALEASATSYTISTDGVAVKTGDTTKTLVGMAYTGTGPVWVDSARQRLVSSYFNRRPRSLYAPLVADRTIPSPGAEITTSDERANFLSWGDEPVFAGARINVKLASGSEGTTVSLNLDGAEQAASTVSSFGVTLVGKTYNNSIPALAIDASAGKHYLGITASYVTAACDIVGTTAPGSAITGLVWG